MNILTKQQAAEIMYRPYAITFEKVLDKCIESTCKLNQTKFIKEFRRSTDLKLCSFGPGLFYIRY